MARSTYVYVVLNDATGGDPVAGFTVKHELVRWLKSRPFPGVYRVWQLPDGFSDRMPGPYDVRELLEGK